MANRGRPSRAPGQKVVATRELLKQAADLVRQRVPGTSLRDIVDFGLRAVIALERSEREHRELDTRDLPKSWPMPSASLPVIDGEDPFLVLPQNPRTIVDPRVVVERGRTIRTLDTLADEARHKARRSIRSLVGSLRRRTPEENREYLGKLGVLDDPAFTALLTGGECEILGVGGRRVPQGGDRTALMTDP